MAAAKAELQTQQHSKIARVAPQSCFLTVHKTSHAHNSNSSGNSQKQQQMQQQCQLLPTWHQNVLPRKNNCQQKPWKQQQHEQQQQQQQLRQLISSG